MLRHNRAFVALWTGQTASAFGTSVSTLAYPLLILAVTGSAALAGAVASAAGATSFLVRIPAGLIVDRVDRRQLMLWCDAVRVVAVGTVALAVWLDEVRLSHLLAVAVVEAAAGSLFGPAETIAVRRVVAPEQVQDAIAKNESRRQLAALAGPAVGGLLFGAGRALPFAVDAASYLVSFLTIRAVRTDLRPAHHHGPRADGWWNELTSGVRWLWSVPLLRTVTLWLTVAGALFTSIGLVTLVLAQELGATPEQTGLMFTIAGVGGLAGALAAPWILRRMRAGVILISYAWLATAAALALLAAQTVWLLGVLGAIAFFPVPAVNALLLSRVAATAPDARQGRIVSSTTQLTSLIQPLAPAIAGLALDRYGSRPTVLGAGLSFAALAAWLTLSSTVRKA